MASGLESRGATLNSPLRRRFTGREIRPVPDRIAQLSEPGKGGVFDGGLVKAHAVRLSVILPKWRDIWRDSCRDSRSWPVVDCESRHFVGIIVGIRLHDWITS